jgi:hypothetical protein
MQARAAQQRDTDMAGIQKQRDAIANMDTTIDSGRWWASRSTPGKILAGLGLALGAVGAGNDGVNRAVGIIDGAINRDLENQKHSHELMFRKMGMGLQAAESAYSLHRQGQQDDIVASEAAKGTMLQLALNQTDQMLAKTSEPAAKAKLMAVRAQLAAQQGAANAKAAQQAFDNNIKTQELDIKRMEAGQKAAGASFVSPGYSLLPGAKPGEVELKDARTSLTEKKNIDAALIKLKGLIKDSWLVPGSAEAAQAQSLIAKLKVGYKNMATLGALSGSDYALIDAAIPDPTSMKGHFTPDKTLIARLDQFGKTANTDLHNKLGTLGIVKDADAPRAAPAQSAEAQAARQWLAANPTDPRAAAVRAKLGL